MTMSHYVKQQQQKFLITEPSLQPKCEFLKKNNAKAEKISSKVNVGML